MSHIAYLFPGQGSQEVGMGADLAAGSASARSIFDQAAGIMGDGFKKLCFEGPEEDLRQTINTQPALYATSCAALEALRERFTAPPFAVAGHSVGEYAALYAAGAMDFITGLKLVKRRAELMHESASQHSGAMAAVLGMEPDVVRQICETARTAGIISVANYNSPGQVVISGERAAVERAQEVAKERGCKRFVMLPVSGAFHCPLMAQAGDTLYPYLRAAIFKNVNTPVVVNVTAEYCTSGVDFAPNLTMQVSGSVRWEESMRLLLADGVDTFVELGSGAVLTGLMKRTDKSVKVISVKDMASLEEAVGVLTNIEALEKTE